jgi:hypothetical protein
MTYKEMPNTYQARAVNREKSTRKEILHFPLPSAERELRLYF